MGITLEIVFIAGLAYLLGFAHARLKKDGSKLTPEKSLKDTLYNLSTSLTRPKIKVFNKRTPEPEEEKNNPNK